MTRKIRFLILAMLLAASVYYYSDARSARALLNERTTFLEKALEDVRDDCEIRIARLRYDYETRLSQRTAPAPGEGLLSLIDAVKERREQTRENVISDVISSLELDEKAVDGLIIALNFYENQKRSLLSQMGKQGGSFLDPAYLEEVNEYRVQTLALFREALPEDKFQIFLEQGYDEKLDLRARRPGE